MKEGMKEGRKQEKEEGWEGRKEVLKK